jgi:hypothetical protein
MTLRIMPYVTMAVNLSLFQISRCVELQRRGFHAHHLPGPLLQHRRRRNSHLARIMGDYERLYANIILNNQEVYSEVEIDAANRFLSIGERVALLRLSKLIFAQSYPVPG